MKFNPIPQEGKITWDRIASLIDYNFRSIQTKYPQVDRYETAHKGVFNNLNEVIDKITNPVNGNYVFVRGGSDFSSFKIYYYMEGQWKELSNQYNPDLNPDDYIETEAISDYYFKSLVGLDLDFNFYDSSSNLLPSISGSIGVDTVIVPRGAVKFQISKILMAEEDSTKSVQNINTRATWTSTDSVITELCGQFNVFYRFEAPNLNFGNFKLEITALEDTTYKIFKPETD